LFYPKINPKKLQNLHPSKKGNPQTTIPTQSTTPRPQKNHTQTPKFSKTPYFNGHHHHPTIRKKTPSETTTTASIKASTTLVPITQFRHRLP
jgi:hypothetical protein